jgi:hypothetical protein
MIMKLTKFLFACVLTITITSCSSGEIDFNNKLVDSQKEVLTKYNGFIAKANLQDTTMNDTLAIEAVEVRKVIDLKLKEANALKVPSGGEKLHKSFIDEFTAMQESVDYYKTMFSDKSTEAEILKAEEWYEKNGDKISTIETELLANQKQFAKDKNFKIK